MPSNLHPLFEALLKTVEMPMTQQIPPLAAEIDGLRAQLRGIVQAYDLALRDPRAMIPTPLQMVIEAARKIPAPQVDAESERYRHEAAMDGDRERMDAVKASFPQRQGFSE